MRILDLTEEESTNEKSMEEYHLKRKIKMPTMPLGLPSIGTDKTNFRMAADKNINQ